MGNLRLFLGIALPVDVERLLGERCAAMKRSLSFRKWTHPADYHITLHYLGNTSPDRLPDISLAAREAADAAAAPRLSLAEPGTFGADASPRVLWCGVEETERSDRPVDRAAARTGTPKLNELHRALGERLRERIRFEPEARPYHPHITLARSCEGGICAKSAIRELWTSLDEAGEPFPPDWICGHITIYRSHLSRAPAYERLEQIPLR